MKPENSTTLKVIAFGLFILFLVFVGLAAPFYLKQRTVLKTWTVTPATVQSSSIVPVPGRHGTDYMARFLLQYRIGDQIHTSLVPSGYGDNNREHAQEWLNRFPVGSKVSIAYNPQNPTMVRLNPGYNRYFFAVPLFIAEVGCLFGGAALILLLVARIGEAKYRRATSRQLTRTK